MENFTKDFQEIHHEFKKQLIIILKLKKNPSGGPEF